MDEDQLRKGLAIMYPQALPAWREAFERLAPALCVFYGFDRLDWVHFNGQIAAETNSLQLKRMEENMRFKTADRILEVFSFRLNRALQKGWPIDGKRFASRVDLARYLVGKPKLLADVVYGDREGTPAMQGSRFIGRGPTQITHLDNYRAIGSEIARQPGGAAFDLVRNPELLADDPELGIRSAFADWHLKGLSRYARADDCDTLSDALNTGNVHDNVRPNGLPRRRAETLRAKKIWGEDFEVVAQKVESAAPANMAQSSEGNAAVLSGGLGTVQVSQEISIAMTKVAASGKGFSFAEFLLQLTTSLTFWAAVLGLALSAFLWFRRRTRLQTLGV